MHSHPQDVLSFTAIEMGLAGFGLEALADVTHGGAWHIGVLAAPGIPEMLLAGRERAFLGQHDITESHAGALNDLPAVGGVVQAGQRFGPAGGAQDDGGQRGPQR